MAFVQFLVTIVTHIQVQGGWVPGQWLKGRLNIFCSNYFWVYVYTKNLYMNNSAADIGGKLAYYVKYLPYNM